MRIEKTTLATLIAGGAAAIAASACCVLPLLLVAAGVGGACAEPSARARHRRLFWGAIVAFALLLAVPYAPLVIA